MAVPRQVATKIARRTGPTEGEERARATPPRGSGRRCGGGASLSGSGRRVLARPGRGHGRRVARSRGRRARARGRRPRLCGAAALPGRGGGLGLGCDGRAAGRSSESGRALRPAGRGAALLADASGEARLVSQEVEVFGHLRRRATQRNSNLRGASVSTITGTNLYRLLPNCCKTVRGDSSAQPPKKSAAVSLYAPCQTRAFGRFSSRRPRPPPREAAPRRRRSKQRGPAVLQPR